MYRCVSSLPSVTFLVVRKGFVSGETEGREKFLLFVSPFREKKSDLSLLFVFARDLFHLFALEPFWLLKLHVHSPVTGL